MEQVYVKMEQTVKRKGIGSENPSSENSAGHRAVLILSDDDIQDFVRKEKEKYAENRNVVGQYDGSNQ